MPFQKGEKSYLTFARGINTDASPVNFPENFSLDEQNFILELDGTRRRRKGLTTETGGEDFATILNIQSDDAFTVQHWSNVANDPGNDLVVVQTGSTLHFFEDSIAAPTSNKLDFTVDLLEHKTNGASNDQVRSSKIDTAFGRGHLFVVGEFLTPFFIKYSDADTSLTITPIDLMERDFEGVDDGLSNTARPTTATSSHTYNLQNRGWLAAHIAAYVASKSTQPSKNMIPWMGLRRITTASVAEEDWTKEFSPDKIVAELFQDASAPVGHFIRSPFENSDVEVPVTTSIPIVTGWTLVGTTVTITTDGNHGLVATNPFTISFNGASYKSSDFTYVDGRPHRGFKLFSLNGDYTVGTAPAPNKITFTKSLPADFISWENQYLRLGSIKEGSSANPSGISAERRPTNVAFFAGRVWYAGTPYEKLANRLYFSQVIESDAQYAKCYQVADPTQEEFNVLVDSDGGVIVVPEMAQILQVIPYSSSLLLYTTNGVWQIGPGGSGYFTATSYSVRKISDRGAISARGVVMAENIPYYWGNSGVYRVLQDPQQGFLYVENISQLIIDRMYNNIPIEDKRNVQGVFNPVSKQIFWLYKGLPDSQVSPLNKILCYDTRLQAFTQWALGSDGGYKAVSLFSIKDLIENLSAGPIRILGANFDTNMASFGAPESHAYKDWNSTEQEAYLVTGYDTVGNPAAFKHGIWIHCFMGKTETGYAVVQGDLRPIGESGCQLQCRWDWADNTSAGKWGTPQQIYRHRRLYTPMSPSDTFDDGQPIIVTKNKIRGRGRSMHLKFSSGAGKDTWLLGWQVLYGAIAGY
jgi:hypothetical protein